MSAKLLAANAAVDDFVLCCRRRRYKCEYITRSRVQRSVGACVCLPARLRGCALLHDHDTKLIPRSFSLFGSGGGLFMNELQGPFAFPPPAARRPNERVRREVGEEGGRGE